MAKFPKVISIEACESLADHNLGRHPRREVVRDCDDEVLRAIATTHTHLPRTGGKGEGGILPGLPDSEASDLNLSRQEDFKSKF